MALMVPIDEDLATLLETEAQRTGESVAARTNRLLRANLAAASEIPVGRPKFRVKPFPVGLDLGGLTPRQALARMDEDEDMKRLDCA